MTHSFLAIANPKITSYFPPAIPNSNYLSCRTTSRGQQRLKIWSKIDDGSVDKFIQTNSIADFMRFKKDSNAQLQTAIVSYRKKSPWSFLQPFLQVDLVSNIHIADKEYFETLQDVLEPYDCVLYEMIAGRENLESRRELTVIKKDVAQQPGGFNIVGFIQQQISKLLLLDFQLDCLDYHRDNWYHADLDFETIEMLLEKGESLFNISWDFIVRATKVEEQSAAIREDLGPWRSKLLWASRNIPMPLVGLFIIGSLCWDTGPEAFPELEALSRLDFGSALKIFLAKRLPSKLPMLFSGEVEKSVIIGQRNRAATQALHQAISIGNNKIAILYGAGHMPDLSRRLQEEFDLVPSDVQWIPAWSIRIKNLTSTSLPFFLTTLARLTRWPLNRYQTLALPIFSAVLALDLLFWGLFARTVLNWSSNISSYIRSFI